MAHPELSNPETVFTFDMLKNCNELECFINESMRMNTVAPVMLPRYVEEEEGVVIGGYHLPKGTAVVVPIQYLMSGEGVGPIQWNSDPLDLINQMVRAERIEEVSVHIITCHSEPESINVWVNIWRCWR